MLIIPLTTDDYAILLMMTLVVVAVVADDDGRGAVSFTDVLSGVTLIKYIQICNRFMCRKKNICFWNPKAN